MRPQWLRLVYPAPDHSINSEAVLNPDQYKIIEPDIAGKDAVATLALWRVAGLA